MIQEGAEYGLGDTSSLSPPGDLRSNFPGAEAPSALGGATCPSPPPPVPPEERPSRLTSPYTGPVPVSGGSRFIYLSEYKGDTGPAPVPGGNRFIYLSEYKGTCRDIFLPGRCTNSYVSATVRPRRTRGPRPTRLSQGRCPRQGVPDSRRPGTSLRVSTHPHYRTSAHLYPVYLGLPSSSEVCPSPVGRLLGQTVRAPPPPWVSSLRYAGCQRQKWDLDTARQEGGPEAPPVCRGRECNDSKRPSSSIFGESPRRPVRPAESRRPLQRRDCPTFSAGRRRKSEPSR